MIEAILGSMSAFIRGGNFAGKRKFLIEVDSFKQLSTLLSLSEQELIDAYGEGV